MFPRSQDGWCPFCPRQSFTWDSSAPYIRTCRSCGFIYLYGDINMPVCSVCGAHYIGCPCRPKLPQVGQIIRITHKLQGDITKTYEGPVAYVTTNPVGQLISVTIGIEDSHTRMTPITRIGRMLEDATWEIILPPEPPNKSVWVCPAGDNGKLAIWRRLGHQASGRDACWFYPGSLSGATWAQVYNTGPGYLLEVKND